MLRAHAVTPAVGADAPFQGPTQSVRPAAPGVSRRTMPPSTSCYLERAIVLWPRLDQSRIRKVADNPARMAEIIAQRTSLPHEAILAMLIKQSSPLTAPAEGASSCASERADASRTALRIVGREEGNAIEVRDLVPA